MRIFQNGIMRNISNLDKALKVYYCLKIHEIKMVVTLYVCAYASAIMAQEIIPRQDAQVKLLQSL